MFTAKAQAARPKSTETIAKRMSQKNRKKGGLKVGSGGEDLRVLEQMVRACRSLDTGDYNFFGMTYAARRISLAQREKKGG